jgi:predicted permease
VRADLTEEARARGRGQVWFIYQVGRIALRMRWTFSGDAAMIDLRYAIRSLGHAKGFTLAAVLTLVLGIGVTLAVFTIVDRMLFRPMPFGHMSRLVMVEPYSPVSGSRYSSFPKALFIEGRRSVSAIEAMGFAGFTYRYAIGREPGTAATLGLTEVSFNLLDVLGTVPVLGRGFQRQDAAAKNGVAIITYEAWYADFGGASSVLGRELSAPVFARDGTVGLSVKTIIGVLPRGFLPPVMNRPLDGKFDGIFMVPDLLETAGPRDAVDPGVARLAPGASIAVAQQQYDSLAARLDSQLRRPGGPPHGPRVLIESLRAGMFSHVYTYLWLVTLAAALVGLLACANLSSLLLARGRSREQDIALRASLGASTGRLLATELAQSLIICSLAAIISLVMLYWTVASLRALVPGYLRTLVLGDIDGRVVTLAGLSALVASLVGGLLPAWRASRTSLVAVMQRGAGAPAHVRAGRAGRAVLAFEAAIGVVLVAGAAIVVRSFVGLLTTDMGFVPDGLHVVHLPAAPRGTDSAVNLARHRSALDLIRQQPGIASAGGVDSMPAGGATAMSGAHWNSGDVIGLWQMTDGFLGAIGAKIVAGQDITRADVDESRPVALVTQAAARTLWPALPDRNVIGQEIAAPDEPTRRVIGVVADVRDRPDQAPPLRVFAPVQPDGFRWLEFAVRTQGQGAGTNVEALRRELSDRLGMPGLSMEPAGPSLTNSLEQPRMQALIFGAFAIVGLLLAALGLFAVASFDVARRRYELGVRAALGASEGQLRRLVVSDALRPVGAGLIVGLIGAYWAAQFAQTLVYHTDARDPWTLALVAMVLLGTAALAALLPARRASRVDPCVVLRTP